MTKSNSARVCVTVKYFASIREAIGLSSEQVVIDSILGGSPLMTGEQAHATVGHLRALLIARGEPYALSLASGKAIRMALNQTMCDETAALHDAAEVAFFPPVTGG